MSWTSIRPGPSQTNAFTARLSQGPKHGARVPASANPQPTQIPRTTGTRKMTGPSLGNNLSTRPSGISVRMTARADCLGKTRGLK
jgi:hypothetical protein